MEIPSPRRGLPRLAGGDAWPPDGPVTTRGADAMLSAVPAAAGTGPSSLVRAAPSLKSPIPESLAPGLTLAEAGAVRTMLRRGLPRIAGGEPWPGAVKTVVDVAIVPDISKPRLSQQSDGSGNRASITASGRADAPATLRPAVVDFSTPLPFERTVFPGNNAFERPAPSPEPRRIGRYTMGQWAGVVLVGGTALVGLAAMAVLFCRWLLSLPFMQDFLATYPGEYPLPDSAPIGIPGWLGWQHFFNVFLMVLIIRSGLRIRTEKRPTAYWSRRGNTEGKVSLTIWFHQSLDLLWLLNGGAFIVLLFATGQWMRVIPTSWEVFPNAISALLQYISLDWPTENGWINYNSIQQMAYFTTIFVAAPLAAVTGFRMSVAWPKNAMKLSEAFPIEWARRLHFPVMLYFVAFIAVHVFLVFATGALRNLNHMYASQGSADPEAFATNWTGFWFLVASLMVIAAALAAARPLVLAPIAKIFGTVTSR